MQLLLETRIDFHHGSDALVKRVGGIEGHEGIVLVSLDRFRCPALLLASGILRLQSPLSRHSRDVVSSSFALSLIHLVFIAQYYAVLRRTPRRDRLFSDDMRFL